MGFVSEMKMELEFIQVDLNGGFRTLDHFSPTEADFKTGFLSGLEVILKKYDGPYRHIYISEVLFARIFCGKR